MVSRIAIALLAILLISGCTRKVDRLQADIDFFRKECAETNDQVACFHYQESLMKMQQFQAAKAAFIGGLISKPQPRSTFSPAGGGSVVHY